MRTNSKIKITECPRDAMQGITAFIPTDLKVEYINSLLKVGFDTIDFGSFVSPRAIPQLSDTAEVVKKLNLSFSKTKLLAIIGNLKGAQQAAHFDEITYLGFPFSLSPTFLQLNIKSTIEDALYRIENIQNLCVLHEKELLVYLSMAFGNPYGDVISFEKMSNTIKYLQSLDIKRISLADTVGIGTAENISALFNYLIPLFPNIEFALHLHSTAASWYEKVDAAYQAGCRQFDAVILGLGGCPMSAKELVGNLKTEDFVSYLEQNKISHALNLDYLKKSTKKAVEVFY
ncbi:MAG: hydroxymethylglutaryl-CoA lyase [Bacteroidetes bacterium]|nr:hydroxymethylglutaryl-CoA lyase [Bacteroidota bacterium]